MQALIDSGKLRKVPEENMSFMKSTLRRFKSNKGNDKMKWNYNAVYETDAFRSFPHSFWAYSKVCNPC